MKLSYSFLILLIVFATSCDQHRGLPKPRSFPRVIFPDKIYAQIALDNCPFVFSIPSYSDIIKDQHYFDIEKEQSCWFDIYTKTFNSKIHCSYYELTSSKQFHQLIGDAFKLAGKHTIKADYIDEHYFENQFGSAGFVFELTGPVASPYQFFITDSTNHFLRGALYFNTKARPDSLGPITAFLKKDIEVFIETLNWD